MTVRREKLSDLAVVIVARRKHMLDEIMVQIESTRAFALAVEGDVSEAAQVSAINLFGRIDIRVNNTGIGATGYLRDIPLEDHSHLVDVNLKGLIYGAYVALDQFIVQGHGTLINTGSIDSAVPPGLHNTHAATQAGIPN